MIPLTRREFINSLSMGTAMFAVSPASLVKAALGTPGEGPSLLPTPSAQQLLWQDMELGMFFHFDIPISKPGWNWRSWQGLPDPNLYQPGKLDTDQWLEAAQAMGAKYAVFVAKHCSGFCQWQTDIYPYGVKQSSWRNGKGDVVEDFVNSCHKYGIKPGLYASVTANAYLEVDNPGLVNRGKGGDPEKQVAYKKTCEQMLTELWSRYGELFEIWFDGGALPVEKGGPDLVPIQKKHQPHAMVFQPGRFVGSGTNAVWPSIPVGRRRPKTLTIPVLAIRTARCGFPVSAMYPFAITTGSGNRTGKTGSTPWTSCWTCTIAPSGGTAIFC